MATTLVAKNLPVPQKRRHVLTIAISTISKAKIQLGAGIFYGGLIVLIVATIYPTLAGLKNILSVYLSSGALSGMLGAHVPHPNGYTAFLAIELYSAIYGLLFGGLMAYAAGASLPLNIENGTIDLALARPISRIRYYLETWLGVMLAAVIMSLFIIFFVWLSTLFVSNANIDWQWYWITQGVLFTFLFFGVGLGMLFASFMNASRAAGGAAVGVIALAYLINIFGSVTDRLDWLLKLLPFYYANGIDVLLNHNLTWWHPWVLVIAGLVLGVIGLFIFNRRDLPTT